MMREQTNWRDQYFPSQWHRQLPEWCKLIDVDAVEWREVNGQYEPTAFIEYKLMNIYNKILGDMQKNRRIHWQLYWLLKLANKHENCKALFVGYTYKQPRVIDYTRVFDISTYKRGEPTFDIVLSEQEYINYLQEL